MLRKTIGALILVLLLLVPSPAAAKGPTQVEVRNRQTGTITTLTMDQPELAALTELVGWPSRRSRPDMVRNGTFTHVATLSWGFDDGQPMWLDKVFSDGGGTVWVSRHSQMDGSRWTAWGRVRAPYTLGLMLAQLGEEQDASPAASTATSPARQARAPAADGFDTSSFGLGAAVVALAGLLIGGVGVRLRRR